MGKLSAIQTSQQPSIPSTSTSTNEQNILEWFKNSTEQQSNNNSSMINLMTQLFNDSSQKQINETQKQQNDVDSFCTSQMAQIAQMMLSAQMTAAASTQMANLNNENGLIILNNFKIIPINIYLFFVKVY
jgi:hypothetical protein